MKTNYPPVGELAWPVHASTFVEVLRDYRARFPELTERFAPFDLHVPAILVEKLTNRRLFPESDVPEQRVATPLAAVLA